MALQGLASSQAPEYKGLDLNIIGDAAKMRQQNFIKANEVMSNALQALQTQDFVDEEARAQATARAQARYGELVKRTQNNLGAALPDVMTAVRETAADPYNMYNKYQMENLKAQNEQKAKLGNKAIVVNDVANQRISEHIDPTGKVSDPITLKNKLSADVREASDYIKVAQSLGDKLDKQLRPIGLRNVKGFDTFLQTGSVNELSEPDILALANDPAVRSAFMTATTAGIDNRPEAGYQIVDGVPTNKFTRPQPAGSKFKDGAAQEIYAALIQKKDKDVQLNYMQNQDALDTKRAARAGAAEKAKAAVEVGHTTRSIPVKSILGFKSEPKFDGENFSKKAKVYPGGGLNPQSGVSFGVDPEDRKKIESFKANWGDSKMTDKAAYTIQQKTAGNMDALKVNPIEIPPAQKAAYDTQLGDNFFMQPIILNGERIDMGNKEGRERFTEITGMSKYNPKQLVADKRLYTTSQNRVGHPMLAEEAGGSLNATVLNDKNEPFTIEAVNSNVETNNEFIPVNKLVQNTLNGVKYAEIEYGDNTNLVQTNYLDKTAGELVGATVLIPKGAKQITYTTLPEEGEERRTDTVSITSLPTVVKAAIDRMDAQGLSKETKQANLRYMFGASYVTPSEVANSNEEELLKSRNITVHPGGKLGNLTTKQLNEVTQPKNN